MGWDEVCVLCGITPVCGPTHIVLNHKRNEVAEDIATEMGLNRLSNMQSGKIASLMMELLSATEPDQYRYSGYPGCREMAYLGHQGDVLAAGYFGTSGGYNPCPHTGRTFHPTGDSVELRRVRDGDSCMFGEVVEYVQGERVVTRRSTYCGSINAYWLFNTFVHVNCYAYLQNWLNCPLSPRIGRLGKPLELAGELYELVNSRRDPPVEAKGTLSCIDYGNVLGAYDDTQYMSSIAGCRQGCANTAKALTEGLRGEQLLTAFLEDCQYYMFMRPDRYVPLSLYDLKEYSSPFSWPMVVTPPTGTDLEWVNSTIIDSAIEQPKAIIPGLPLELLSEICQYLDLPSIFAVSFTCKTLYGRVLERSTLVYALRRSMTNLNGALHWLLPIATLSEERERAYEAMLTWVPGNPVTDAPVEITFGIADFPEDDESDSDFVLEEREDEDEDEDYTEYESGAEGSECSDVGMEGREIEDVPLPLPEYVEPEPKPILLFAPDFPLLPFIRACFMSGHMKARRRRWQIIKQFDTLWTNYRRDGWERNHFTSENVTWEMVDDAYICQCS